MEDTNDPNTPVESRPDKLDPHHGFRLHLMTLYSVIYGMEAKSVFEFGCGYSTKVMLDAISQTGGKLITNDLRKIEDTTNTQEMLEKHKHHWTYLEMRSDEALQNGIKDERFDVVLHDGAHEPQIVIKDIRKIVKHMKQDALLLVHDTNHRSFPYLRWAVRLALFPYRYEMVTLPYGAGLSIIRIKSNFGNGKVELTWKKGEVTKMGPNQ